MKKLLGILALTCTGCTHLWSMSSGPATTKAELDLVRDRVDVTQGVAFAISCRHVAFFDQPCDKMTVTSDDPSIARVSFVHLDKYRNPAGYVHDIESQQAVFLIAGVRPGVTKVRVGGDDADEVLEVYVTGPESAEPASH